MPELIAPTTRVHQSYLQAVREYVIAIERGGALQLREHAMVESRFHSGPDALVSHDMFADYVQRLVDDALPEAPRPEGFVPATHLWLVEGDEYLGAVDIRHAMTPFLINEGGTIGYDIRPSARGKGYGKMILALALPRAKELGFDPVLVTCSPNNTASIGVIEANGGVLEDERNNKLRFWVPTS